MTASDENANPNLADNILMLPQKSLDQIKKQLKSGEEFSAEGVIGLTSTEGLKDKDMVIPTDLRGISDNFEEEFEDDFEVMLDKLGPKGTAEGLLKAHEYWESNKANEAADARAKPLSFEDFHALTGEDDENDEDDDDADEDDDAGGEGDEEEDGDDDDEDEADEPASKKQKTAPDEPRSPSPYKF